MPNSLNEKILSLARHRFRQSLSLRRSLHRIPEIAWQEKKTSATIKRFLLRNRIEFREVASTGIVARIDSGDGKCVAIRADIDALPVTEETGYPFRSRNPGRMHACGHDIHMAAVSMCALLLDRLRSHFQGTVKLIYQPAEEAPPGGAKELVKAGVLDNPPVEMIFSLHAWPSIPVGKIEAKDGPLCAGVLDFDIEVMGKGGHGAYPHASIDPIVCASGIVTALQTIVSRNTDPFEPAVVTIGRIESGSARNVIPPSCRLYGTARAQNAVTMRKLRKRIEAIVMATARSHQCRASIQYCEGYPPLINNPQANRYLVQACRDLFGRNSVSLAEKPTMGGEDFAYYLQEIPGAMFMLGVGNPEIGASYCLHHPKFKADEASIPVGAAILTKAAIDFLND